jgi:hypothetical protein
MISCSSRVPTRVMESGITRHGEPATVMPVTEPTPSVHVTVSVTPPCVGQLKVPLMALAGSTGPRSEIDALTSDERGSHPATPNTRGRISTMTWPRDPPRTSCAHTCGYHPGAHANAIPAALTEPIRTTRSSDAVEHVTGERGPEHECALCGVEEVDWAIVCLD